MHVVIGESLDLAKAILSSESGKRWPTYSGLPLEKEIIAPAAAKATAVA